MSPLDQKLIIRSVPFSIDFHFYLMISTVYNATIITDIIVIIWMSRLSNIRI